MTAPSPALVAAADLIGKELVGEAFQVFANLMESAGIWPDDSEEPTPLEELGAAVGRLRRARAAGDDLVAAREWANVVRLRREVASMSS